MGHLFFSHASSDRVVADQICEAIESRGVSCWIAPRDVSAGTSYPSAILSAIRSCDGAILLITEESNRSSHVKREIERIASRDVPVYVFRIDPVELADEFEYFVSLNQWIDASEGSMDAHIEHLVAQITGDPNPGTKGVDQSDRNAARPGDGSVAPSPEVDGSALSFSELAARQRQMLVEFGRVVVDFVCLRPDPSSPISRQGLLQALQEKDHTLFRGVSFGQFTALLNDAKTYGCIPGLTENEQGFFVAGDYITFKLERNTQLKEDLGDYASKMVESGQTLGIDGGSTTLPIARRICGMLHDGVVADLSVITNSISIARVFTDLMAEEGWTDEDCPVKLSLAGGNVRPNTHATDWGNNSGSRILENSRTLFAPSVSLDLCFLGANGFTAAAGLTMRAKQELGFKRATMEASERAFYVADSSKFGVELPVCIASWDETFTLLTNTIETGDSTELFELLESGQIVEVGSRFDAYDESKPREQV